MIHLRLAIALIASVAILSASRADDTPKLLPFEPAKLLAALPTAPAEWKTLRSEANTTLGEWLETRATRVFQSPPPPTPPNSDPPAAPPVPGEIEVTIIDTAGFTPPLASFNAFTPGKNGNLEKRLIGSLPAIIITNENGQQFTQVLVSARYLIELKLTNLPRHRPEDWLKTFHFDALPPSVNSTPTTRPREFRLSHVDELQPKNNRSYAVSTTSAKRLDTFLKTLPPAPTE